MQHNAGGGLSTFNFQLSTVSAQTVDSLTHTAIVPTVAAKADLAAPVVDSLATRPENRQAAQADSLATKTENTPAAAQADSLAEIPLADYENPREYTVRAVNIHGSNYYAPSTIKAAIGLNVGDKVTIPGEDVSGAISKLWGMRYFSNVEVQSSMVGEDGVAFDIYLTERPRVRTWRFEGARKGERDELDAALKLRPGTELSDYILDKNKRAISEFYFEKGFRHVDVTTRIDNDSIVRNAVNVTFVIARNKKVRIGEIVFEGNHQFKTGKLRRTFKKTHQIGINFFQSNKFKAELYKEDKELLLDFYNSKGYRNATILRDSIYDINEKRMGIKLVVDEGNKFYYRNVSWIGNTIYTTEYLDNLLSVNQGDTYDRKSLHKRLGVGREPNIEDNSTVTALYQNNGYLMSSIDPAEVVVGPDSLDLVIKIFEGKPFTINNVKVSGNEKVHDYVIRRELATYPGDLYSRELIMNTIYRLGSMNHFNAEAIAPDIQPVSNDLVDIGWNLQEQPSDKVDISGGWGAGMFVFSAGVQLNNLSLRKFFKKGAWRPYPQGQNQQLAISGQTNGQYYQAISLRFTEPWLGGKKPHSFTIGAYYSAENNAYYFWQKGTAFFHTVGVSAGIGFRLAWPDQYFTLYTELGYQRYMLNNWRGFLMGTGNSNIITLRTVFGRSSISQPVYPRYGSDFSIALTLTPPFSLFDKLNYNNPQLPDTQRYKWIEYHKWVLKGRYFQPISRDQKLVLMAKIEMGYLGYYNPRKLSPFEGFRIGGDGMTGYTLYGEDVIGMRGYKDAELVPMESQNINDNARVYNKYTIELRYPIIMQPRSTIYVLGFAEAGNGYSSWKKFNPFQVKRSAGAGVRIMLPVVGMLGLDWGWGFDPPAGGTRRSGSNIHFSFGTQF